MTTGRLWLRRASIAMAIAVASVLAACGGGGGTTDEPSDDPNLPGIYVPDQGRGHFRIPGFGETLEPTPFCDGVAHAAEPGAPSVTPPAPVDGEPTTCYASNPPSSGWHLGVQSNVDLGNGIILPRIPPDPNVYPPEAEIPREAIPHILEHAGVFVGYHCADGDAACAGVVERLADVVNDRIDNHNDRVVMARDSDLPEGTIGLAVWTRIDTFGYAAYDEDRVVEFIDVYSCRYDPENFCR